MSSPPDRSAPFTRPPTASEEAALAWVVRCERGLTADQESEFRRWLDTDGTHPALFAEFGGTWEIMGRAETLPNLADASTTKPLPFEAESSGGRERRKRSRGARTIWLTLAAAAAIAIGIAGWQRATVETATYATEIGVARKVALPDGSLLELNTETLVSTRFTRGVRELRLEKGEAYFQVAKDPNRPFVVEAAGVGVRAIGTAFNVRLRADAVEVLVTEGIVQVNPPAPGAASVQAGAHSSGTPAATSRVGAGERISVPVRAMPTGARETPAAAAAVLPDEIQRTLAWQSRTLEFSDTALADMAAEFNRYHARPLVVPDPAVAGIRFGGSFRVEDRAGFLRVLADNFGIVAEERGGQTVLRSK